MWGYMQNYYEILQIKPTANETEIKVAYIELIKKYHPDTYSGDKVFAEHKTADINEAYATLKDSLTRKKYDHKLKQKQQPKPTPKQEFKTSPEPTPQDIVKKTNHKPNLLKKVKKINKEALSYDITAIILFLLLVLVVIIAVVNK
jgi:curved DNA-binding protein CbpA